MDNIKNLYLHSWKNELSNNIKEKEEKILEVLSIISTVENTKNSKENEIKSLEKTMDINLNNVEKHIEDYLTNNQKKFDDIKNNNQYLKDRSNKLFSLYKILYEDACIFFSRKEFKYELSTLKSEINNKFKLFFYFISNRNNIDNINDIGDDKWTSILTPIWLLENQYNDMEIKYKEMVDSYNITEKMFNEKKEDYEKLKIELSIMKNELSELTEFSNKIQDCKKK